VIVVRPDKVSDVLATAEAIVAREAAMIAEIEKGTPMSIVLGGNYEHMLQKD